MLATLGATVWFGVGCVGAGLAGATVLLVIVPTGLEGLTAAPALPPEAEVALPVLLDVVMSVGTGLVGVTVPVFPVLETVGCKAVELLVVWIGEVAEPGAGAVLLEGRLVKVAAVAAGAFLDTATDGEDAAVEPIFTPPLGRGALLVTVVVPVGRAK